MFAQVDKPEPDFRRVVTAFAEALVQAGVKQDQFQAGSAFYQPLPHEVLVDFFGFDPARNGEFVYRARRERSKAGKSELARIKKCLSQATPFHGERRMYAEPLQISFDAANSRATTRGIV